MNRSVDLTNIICDNYVEERFKRYAELTGHIHDLHHKLYFNIYDDFISNALRIQAKQQEEWNCLTEQEKSLSLILLKFDSHNYNKKLYIKHCDLCTICYEPITNNTNAYLTECGHPFHKTCITRYYNHSYNRKQNGKLFNWRISCPICRNELIKCTWLETKYTLEPWRLEFCNKSCRNLDYNFYKNFISHDILRCRGCKCTPGCGNIVGTGHKIGCKACYMWKYFSKQDLLNHNKHCCLVKLQTNKKNHKLCSLWFGIRNIIHRLITILT